MNILIYCLCVDYSSQFYCCFLLVLNGGVSLFVTYFPSLKRIDTDREGVLHEIEGRSDERGFVYCEELSIKLKKNILIVVGTIMAPDLFHGGGSDFIVFQLSLRLYSNHGLTCYIIFMEYCRTVSKVGSVVFSIKFSVFTPMKNLPLYLLVFKGVLILYNSLYLLVFKGVFKSNTLCLLVFRGGFSILSLCAH